MLIHEGPREGHNNIKEYLINSYPYLVYHQSCRCQEPLASLASLPGVVNHNRNDCRYQCDPLISLTISDPE
jgi:hypothetical protein